MDRPARISLDSRVVAAILALTISAVRTPLRGTSFAGQESTAVAGHGLAAIGLSDLVLIAVVFLLATAVCGRTCGVSPVCVWRLSALKSSFP